MALLLVAVSLLAVEAVADIALIAERSRIQFTGSKPGKSHDGGFKQFTVTGNVDWAALADSTVRIEIDARSVWSDDGGLTAHLKAADFLDVARHPTIVFETRGIEIQDARTAVVTGALSMLGQTVEVVAPCRLELTDKGLTIRSAFRIDRTLWGMTYGKHIEPNVEVAVVLVVGR
ncbi:MAG: YceI family protein [Burkholderiales bacterium]